MSRSIVSKLGVLTAFSLILSIGALAFVAIRGVENMSLSVGSVAERMLNEDIENKNAMNAKGAEDYGKAMSSYLAWISAAPLWNFNEESLMDYAAGMLEVPNVAYAVIYDDGGAIAAGEKPEGDGFSSFKADIVHEEEVIGSVEVGLDLSYLGDLRKGSEETRDHLIAEFNRQASETERAIRNRTVTISIVLLSAVLALNVFVLLRVASPLRKMTEVVRDLGEGEGDLTVRMDIKTSDEVGRLCGSLNQFMDKLSALVVDMMSIARKLGEDSHVLAERSQSSLGTIDTVKSSMEEIMGLSQTNAAAVEESNAGVEEMAATADSVAKASERGVEASSKTYKFTEGVSNQMEQVVQDINGVSVKSQENRKKMSSLENAVESITGFVGAITGIADQTNLLALNAAIEAARAGDAGKGFAVVAEEVRKLAEESNSAAQEISSLIETLSVYAKESIQGTVEEEEILGKVVDRADRLRNDLASSMKEIEAVDGVMNEVSELSKAQSMSSTEMANAVDSIAKGTSEIVERLGDIGGITEEAKDAFESVVSQTEVLLEGMDQLRRHLDQFKV
ncbi:MULTISPECIES: methyl-accepting chemotaxis protein [Dethiosulfovibrio]|uniref:Methyl-accepting chemotaxis protein n=2 Tax=Dethiosulfovibrio TaxID=47054 RepID=A0ABS9ENF1_9BACT|nr:MULTISPECIES: methyl-accepting chemotaxis protein [Dethiosulfovibrio]MCF4114115.1 methyl-accepting chemotaxis protein [Dethiosulfovibrio russensis]MCF4142695.1 methyl-accepting chemotaxis protein [Dethiosulfovibrio marinus]MCF4144741.1 methyl-accepting chemotaxis protein [Dethiosulfovibrio acidaminovorans]